jgi:DNA-binding NarL/FixJ family response regulator
LESVEFLARDASNHRSECALLGAAGALTGNGRFAEATVVLSAAARAASVWWEPPDAPDFDSYRETLAARLAPDELNRLWAEGEALDRSQALAYARDALKCVTTGQATGTVPASTGLSHREREILGLLVEGLSNREIAERLVVSVRTVETHVAHVCDKLGVRTRTQAVSEALSRGLVSAHTSEQTRAR